MPDEVQDVEKERPPAAEHPLEPERQRGEWAVEVPFGVPVGYPERQREHPERVDLQIVPDDRDVVQRETVAQGGEIADDCHEHCDDGWINPGDQAGEGVGGGTSRDPDLGT
jgi:hypothetical protein